MNKAVCKLVCYVALLFVAVPAQAGSKKEANLPEQIKQVITVSQKTPYIDTISTKENMKDMNVILKMEFDEPNNVLTVSLKSAHYLFGFKNNSRYKHVIRNKRLSLKRFPYKVVSEPDMTYRLSKNVRNNIPGWNYQHTFASWVSTTGLHPQTSDYEMVTENFQQKFDIVGDTTITVTLGDIMMMERSVSKKNRYDLTFYTNLNKSYVVNINRNPCLGKEAELDSSQTLLDEIKENYTSLASKYPNVENLTQETLFALEEVRVKLETKYEKKETTNECPAIASMLENYNTYVDSIAKLADVKAEFAHKRPRLSMPADQLLAVARMVDANVALWLVSNDVVEKADLVKRNRKLIDDINKKISNKMRMDTEQTKAYVVFKKAERYFNETCQNKKK